MLSLDWRLVDLDTHVARLRGAGGRETKNAAPYRDVPLSPRAEEVLKRTPVAKRVGLVFPLTPTNIKQTYVRAVKAARRAYEREIYSERLTAAGMTEREAKSEIGKVIPRGGPSRYRTPPAQATLRIQEALAADPMLKDLTFHDLRHEATSRLAEHYKLEDLMKITGHKSTTMLARYYHPRAADLAKRLHASAQVTNQAAVPPQAPQTAGS